MEPTQPTGWPWLIPAITFVLGFAAWIIPVASFWVAYFFAMGQHEVGPRELLLVACAVAVAVFAAPIGLMVWQKWYPAAIAYAVGGLLGVGPVVAFGMWFLAQGAGRH